MVRMRSPVRIWSSAPLFSVKSPLSAAYADVAQSVERILGKDEVTSSNLVISSMKPMSVLLIGFFVSRKFSPDPLSFRAGLRYNDFMIYLPSVFPTKRRKHL